MVIGLKKVSIIVPVYDVEAYIGTCLSTLVNQSYKQLEIICIIDGSPDDSVDVCKEFQKQSPDLIKIFEKENGGLSDARNYGFKHATGDYIIFIDSDDYVNHDFISKLVKAIEDNNADIAFSEVDLVYPTFKRELLLIDRYAKMDQEQLFISLYPSAWNKMYTREFIEKHDLEFKKGLKYEDVNYIYKALVHSPKIVFVSDSIYYYRQRQNSMIKVVDSSVDDLITGLIDVIEYCKQIGLFEKYFERLEYVCVSYTLATYMKLTAKINDRNHRADNITKAFSFLDVYFPNYRQNKYLNIKNNRSRYLKHVTKQTMPIVLRMLKNRE